MASFQVDPPSRLNAIGNALKTRPEFAPSPGVTHCNQFLAAFADEAFQYTGFTGSSANGIVDFLRGGTDDWERLFDKAAPGGSLQAALSEAQDLANQGFLVVIGLKMPGGAHGHCVVVVTGSLSPSSSWSSAGLADRLPQIAQAGTEVFCDKHLGFGISPASCAAGELAIFVRRP